MTQTAEMIRDDAISNAAELDRPPTANWVLVDACLLAANLLEDESSFDLAVDIVTKNTRRRINET